MTRIAFCFATLGLVAACGDTDLERGATGAATGAHECTVSWEQRVRTRRGKALREKRNAILVVILLLAFCWSFWAWLLVDADGSTAIWVQRIISVLLMVGAGGFFLWSQWLEDKLPDLLRDYVGDVCYEQAGLCFMPVMRKEGERAYIHIYYQNRYDSPVEAIIHLRPPENTVQHRPDAKDIHFAFICPGGGVGVMEQPVAVHPRLQGQTVDVLLAAAIGAIVLARKD